MIMEDIVEVKEGLQLSSVEYFDSEEGVIWNDEDVLSDFVVRY